MPERPAKFFQSRIMKHESRIICILHSDMNRLRGFRDTLKTLNNTVLVTTFANLIRRCRQLFCLLDSQGQLFLAT